MDFIRLLDDWRGGPTDPSVAFKGDIKWHFYLPGFEINWQRSFCGQFKVCEYIFQ